MLQYNLIIKLDNNIYSILQLINSNINKVLHLILYNINKTDIFIINSLLYYYQINQILNKKQHP